MVPDLPLVDVPACVVHGERFAELRYDAAGTPLPAPDGTHLELALSNGDAVLRCFKIDKIVGFVLSYLIGISSVGNKVHYESS